jgi:hypothetical protein
MQQVLKQNKTMDKNLVPMEPVDPDPDPKMAHKKKRNVLKSWMLGTVGFSWSFNLK